MITTEQRSFNLEHLSDVERRADGVNWYAYVGNNPLKWTDPTGLKRDPDDDRSFWDKVKDFFSGSNNSSIDSDSKSPSSSSSGTGDDRDDKDSKDPDEGNTDDEAEVSSELIPVPEFNSELSKDSFLQTAAGDLIGDITEDFTGTIVSGYFFTASAIAKYSYFAGEATEFSAGNEVDHYQIKTNAFGAELNAGVELGKTTSINLGATKEDILGDSVTSELSISIPGIAGSYGSNSASPSSEVSMSVGYSVIPISPSIEFNKTKVSTYDYNASVRVLHSQTELDGWIRVGN